MIKIACLPVAGIENPYQFLMIEGLNSSNNINAFNGVDDRFFGILRTVLRDKPDYLHFDWINRYYTRKSKFLTYSLLPLFMLQVLVIKLFTSVKLVWTLHNILPHNSETKGLDKFIRIWFAKNCKWIRVFSDETAIEISKMFKVPCNKIKIIPEGDYSSVYPNNIKVKDARKQLNLKNNHRVFLFMGFIRPYKGIDKLIKVFSQLNNENTTLLIVGKSRDDNYLKFLKDQIQTNNILLIDKFIPNNELQLYYNSADAVILPFDKVENSGSAIMAMGFKKLIIAPNMGTLKKRLLQQKDFLYNDNKLESVLNEVIALSVQKIQNFGILNYNSLTSFKWIDFQKAFLNE